MTTFHSFSLLYKEAGVWTILGTLFHSIAYILSLFVNWTASFCFLTQYMYALEEFIRYYQVSLLVVLIRPHPRVCLENRRMKNGCYYLY